uniref:Non-POU domain-containing octamer-binding protein-like isoform X2 n=1 Tax=Dermatophagoides pteronyssinus TaxID=6956 RepID=A0A6P6XMW9_DERPT|nr:non-POU domain-containing octamer-binding protein-like isoform X2 [Dermatophagoides pteronyssinus]
MMMMAEVKQSPSASSTPVKVNQTNNQQQPTSTGSSRGGGGGNPKTFNRNKSDSDIDSQHQQQPSDNQQQSQNKQQQNKKRKSNSNHPHYHHNQDGDQLSANYNGMPSSSMIGPRLTGQPIFEFPPPDQSTQTFTGRCRLFVANLPSTATEEALRKLFSEFGQISEIFIGKGNQFAFIKMDTRSNAENAKNALDGKPFEGRTLRVRLAAHAAAIKVTNLPPCVSNELLQFAFSTFGPVERAIVVADDRGRSINEGIVEFARKSSAQAAIKKCTNECLLLTASPLPCVATSLESRDEEEGVPEKNIQYQSDYRREREIGPRFSEPSTIENEIAKKWKDFIQHEAERRQAFEAEMQQKRENFVVQMEYFRLEEETKRLREQLQRMESQVQHMNVERDSRQDYERQREEMRRHHENVMRQQEEQLMGGQQHTPNEMNMLRRQESDLRQQVTTLHQMLERQEQSLRQMDPMGQHMDSQMYGQQQSQMMPGNNVGNGPPQPVPPPHQTPMSGLIGPIQPSQPHGPANPYGHQQNHHFGGLPPPHSQHQQQQQQQQPQQPPQHPQMNHHHHPYGGVPPPSMPGHHPGGQMQQPVPIVPYNGVPPPQLYGQQPPSQQQQQQQQSGMNHENGNNNYGKRNRRY